MSDTVYRLRMPDVLRSCTVFNSPHSGREYPENFLARSRLSTRLIRSSEDAFVDELFEAAVDNGAPLLAARVPRACVDLNRGADELDPALIIGASRRVMNPRIAAGLGVIPRVVGDGRVIMPGKLPLAEAEHRIKAFYIPYHARLHALLTEQQQRCGQAILLDCHSMPHDALGAAPTIWGRRPNVILGDRFGASCDRWVIEAATEIFRSAGFVVARNAPFAGGYITQHYGQPRNGCHALQIEIDRALYMDEERVERGDGFADVQRAISGCVAELAQLRGQALPVAAE